MVIKNVNLEIVCGITSKIPDTAYNEVAFAGKSNVGKSSLINALMNRKALARTSAQPGKTQTINFYNINDAMYLVDLPGYGYAKASEEVKAKWGKMIENYLHTSKRLKAVFLLIDIRHDPSANDRMMYEWMVYQGFAPIIIATKLDKIKRSQIQKNVKAIREGLGVQPGTTIIPFSAETKQGRDLGTDRFACPAAGRVGAGQKPGQDESGKFRPEKWETIKHRAGIAHTKEKRVCGSRFLRSDAANFSTSVTS